jgi:hypothetical protein
MFPASQARALPSQREPYIPMPQGRGSTALVVEGPEESRLRQEYVERYHYLGSRVPFGSNLRYWVRNRQRELACLLWTSPA